MLSCSNQRYENFDFIRRRLNRSHTFIQPARPFSISSQQKEWCCALWGRTRILQSRITMCVGVVSVRHPLNTKDIYQYLSNLSLITRALLSYRFCTVLKVTRHLLVCIKNSKNLRPLDILACDSANKPSFQNTKRILDGFQLNYMPECLEDEDFCYF